MAKCGFERLLQAVLGTPDVDHERNRVGDQVLDRQAHVDDVLVFREHQRLVLGRADASDIDRLNLVNHRRCPAQTRLLDLLLDGTEAEDDAPLLLIEGVEA